MLIYKNYDQEQLDLQYNNRFHVPEYETHMNRWESFSRIAEKKYPVTRDVRYGNLPRECFDVFPSGKPGSKTLVFIHGGYWKMLSKSTFHFIAGAFAGYGITTVLINYPLAPEATLDQLVTSCHQAIQFLHENAGQFSINAEEIYVAGHSAGGHLASMLMANKADQNRDIRFIKGICSLSGIFNLVPVQLSNQNDEIKLTNEMAERNSPAMLNPVSTCPLLLFVGADETPEFVDQTMELYENWKSKTNLIELEVLPGLNHYSIVESVADKGSYLHRKVCQLMKI